MSMSMYMYAYNERASPEEESCSACDRPVGCRVEPIGFKGARVTLRQRREVGTVGEPVVVELAWLQAPCPVKP